MLFNDDRGCKVILPEVNKKFNCKWLLALVCFVVQCPTVSHLVYIDMRYSNFSGGNRVILRCSGHR